MAMQITETNLIRIHNMMALKAAGLLLREVLAGPEYGISKEELMFITKPMAEIHMRMATELEPSVVEDEDDEIG